MKKHIRNLFLVLFSLLFLFSSCTAGESPATEPAASPMPTSTPVVDAPEAEQETITQHPHEYVEYDPFEYAASFARAEGDLDGDGIDDEVIVWSEYLFQVPFFIEVNLSSGIRIRDKCDLTCLEFSSDVPEIVDITNDGKTDIIFPDLGGTDTVGSIYCLLIELEDDALVQTSVFKPGFFGQTDSTYLIESPWHIENFAEHQTVEVFSRPTGESFPIDCSELLKNIVWHNDVWNIDSYFPTFTFSGRLVEFENDTYGIKIATSIELCFRPYNGEDKPASRAFYTMCSTIRCDDGEWIVIEEELLPDDVFYEMWYRNPA